MMCTYITQKAVVCLKEITCMITHMHTWRERERERERKRKKKRIKRILLFKIY